MAPRSVKTVATVQRALRLTALCAALAAIAGLTGVWAARARAQEWLAGVGGTLTELAQAYGPLEATTLHVNGLRFRIETATTSERLDQVLDRAERSCKPAAVADGRVLRHDDGTRGHVACLAPSPRGRELGRLHDRAISFLRELDPSYFGDVRLVRAERHADSTFVVSIASEGPMPLRKAFPARGDAVGADLPGVPRPPSSRRLFSAAQAGQSPALNAYGSDGQDVRELLTRYRATLTAAGFRVADATTVKLPVGSVAFIASRADTRLGVVGTPDHHTRGLLWIAPL